MKFTLFKNKQSNSKTEVNSPEKEPEITADVQVKVQSNLDKHLEKQKVYPNPNNLFPCDILMIHYAQFYHVGKNNDFPGFWNYLYHQKDPASILKKVEKLGYIEPSNDVQLILSKYKINQLKELLIAHDLPTKEKKQELIDYIVGNIDSNEIIKACSTRPYSITELGKKELDDNYYVTKLHQTSLNPNDFNNFFKGSFCYGQWDFISKMIQWHYASNGSEKEIIRTFLLKEGYNPADITYLSVSSQKINGILIPSYELQYLCQLKNNSQKDVLYWKFLFNKNLSEITQHLIDSKFLNTDCELTPLGNATASQLYYFNELELFSKYDVTLEECHKSMAKSLKEKNGTSIRDCIWGELQQKHLQGDPYSFQYAANYYTDYQFLIDEGKQKRALVSLMLFYEYDIDSTIAQRIAYHQRNDDLAKRTRENFENKHPEFKNINTITIPRIHELKPYFESESETVVFDCWKESIRGGERILPDNLYWDLIYYSVTSNTEQLSAVCDKVQSLIEEIVNN